MCVTKKAQIRLTDRKLSSSPVRPRQAGPLLLKNLAPESLADLGKRASLPIRQAQPGWQVRPHNSVLRHQILVLQKQFLVHQSRGVRQETSPMIAFHTNCPSSQVSDS